MPRKTKKGRLIIITGASGVGKTVIANELLKSKPNLKKIITETNRPARPNEIHGIDYYFRSTEEFSSLNESGYYAEVNEYRPGEFKGTATSHFEKIMQGESFIWVVDQVRATDFHTKLNLDKNLLTEIKSRTITILIKVSNSETLKSRYQEREINPNLEIFESRLKKDLEEQSQLESLFDHIVTNDGSLKDTVDQIDKIIKNSLSSKGAVRRTEGFRQKTKKPSN